MNRTLGARLAIATVAVATVASALTGCSAFGGSDVSSSSTSSPRSSVASTVSPDQSKADACAAVRSGIDTLQGLQSQAGAAMSDPQKALDLFGKMADTMQSIESQVGNPEVKAPLDKAAAAVDDYAAFLHDVVKNPLSIDVKKAGEKATALTQSVTDLARVCA